MTMLNRIQIKGLFGQYSYDIDLNNGYDISVLIAPNGCGKTSVFKIVDCMFEPTEEKFKEILDLSFESCTCYLANGNTITLEISEVDIDDDIIEKYGIKVGPSRHIYKSTAPLVELLRTSVKIAYVITKKDGHCSRIDFSNILAETDIYDRDYRKAYDIPYRFFHHLQTELYLQECCIDVEFISADRLQRGKKVSEGYSIETKIVDPISKMQGNMTRIRNTAIHTYEIALSRALYSLPRAVINSENQTVQEYSIFKKKWDQYISDLTNYHEIGLLPLADDILGEEELKKKYDEDSVFLEVYLDVFSNALNPLRETYEQMNLMAEIFKRRNRITGKEIKYGAEGIEVFCQNRQYDLDCLSSGEIHDLYMYYELVFGATKGGLVLIDEPELSWHIEWQEDFLDDLLRICSMNNLQAIVATHSPHIVNGHFELYAERGLENESSGD